MNMIKPEPILHNAPKVLILKREDMINPHDSPSFLIGVEDFPLSNSKFHQASVVLLIDNDGTSIK